MILNIPNRVMEKMCRIGGPFYQDPAAKRLPDGSWDITLMSDTIEQIKQMSFPGESLTDALERTIDWVADLLDRKKMH